MIQGEFGYNIWKWFLHQLESTESLQNYCGFVMIKRRSMSHIGTRSLVVLAFEAIATKSLGIYK